MESTSREINNRRRRRNPIQEVLLRIRRNLSEAIRSMNQGNHMSAKIKLNHCNLNLNRVRNTISSTRFNTLSNSITGLMTICDENQTTHDFSFNPQTIVTGRGRPSINITKDQLEFFLAEGYTAAQIATNLKCSKSLIYKRCYEEGFKFRNKYTAISDHDLLNHMRLLTENFPNSGSEMMCSYLRAQGIYLQRTRVRQVLKLLDPVGTAARWGRTVQRRTYSVPTPNSLWHMDAHLKLVRWGFVVHGCIDGYSRLITYLQCTTSITASAVINIFVPAIVKYGLPSRVRSDHGYENMFVAILMNALRGLDRGSHITGTSVHNQRIERLWRDVYEHVLDKFYNEFCNLENTRKLNPENESHRYLLQNIYLKEINKNLQIFVQGWNRHRIRTEHRNTPRQIWLNGMIQNRNSDHTSIQEIFNEPSNLHDRLKETLSNLGVDLHDNVTSENVSQLTAVINLTEEQKLNLWNITEQDSTCQEKFIAALDII